MRETRYRFEGGPLDGVVRRKTRPARHPFYRDTERGEALPVSAGDRFNLGRGARTAIYAQHRPEVAEDGALVVVYTYRTRP